MLPIASLCPSDGNSLWTPHSSPLTADDADVDGYHTVKALFQETRALVATCAGDSLESIRLASKRCEVSEERLENLRRDLGYSVSRGPDTLSSVIGWRVKRYLKHDEHMHLQASYRDSVILLRDIVLR